MSDFEDWDDDATLAAPRVRYQGEDTRPTTQRELNAYNYFRKNVAGVQREWWFHRSGCRAWFQADRDTRTNVVLATALPGELPEGDATA